MFSIVFKLVQDLLKCVQTCSKLVQMRCTKGITQYSCKTDVPWWRDVHMNTFIHSPVSPLLVDIASYNQFHLAITYQGANYRTFQCKGSDMSCTTWSSLNGKRNKIFLLTTTALGGKGQQTSVWGLCPSFSSIVRKKTFFVSRNLPSDKIS